VLIDTFLVRTLMVPAIVVLCRRYNWWPSRLARRSAEAAAEAGGQQPAAATRS
jgi:RND superfamily putative drug exporter